MNESKRQQKFARLIQRDISEIFQRDKLGIFSGKMVSVAEVQMSPDLSVATLFLSMLLVEDKTAMLEKIEQHKSEIRKALGNKIGKQVRIIPHLVFAIDEVEENASRIERIIDQLDIPKEDPEND